MVSALISRIVILVFGTIYPAYASYKAIRTKNVREYVKWMMYWIVFALFCAVETFSDVFISWLPFYYEVKIVFVIWLLSPVTKGSSFLYKKFVHPQLTKREKEIDEYIKKFKSGGYNTLLSLGTRGLRKVSDLVVEGAVKGRGKLVDHIRKSYSTNDLRLANNRAIEDEVEGPTIIDDEDELDNRILEDNRELENRRTRKKLQRSASDATDNRRHVSGQTDNRRRGSDNTDNRDQDGDDWDDRPLKRHSKSVSAGLQILPEEEEELEHSVTEEYIVNKYGQYTRKEIARDPYATLPRTRARNRPKLN